MLEIEYGGLHKVISGGQTGADQGGLLAAWSVGVETGGVAPANYKTQAGHNPLLEILGLSPHRDPNYNVRTKLNVDGSDGTIIIAHNVASPGTAYTMRMAATLGKPYHVLNISELVRHLALGEKIENELVTITDFGTQLFDFIVKNRISCLNVAGNREIHSDGSSAGTLVVTTVTRWIVTAALLSLEKDGKLIKRKELF